MENLKAQSVDIIAFTTEVADDNATSADMIKDLEIFSGKAAGVCYMKDDYLSSGIQDADKALKRAISTAARGHQSVFDHAHISFMIKTNKIMAMTLNSLGVYTTSEKSARYTKMEPKTELEKQLYEKWINKFRELILDRYPNYDDVVLKARVLKTIKQNKVASADLNITVVNGEVAVLQGDDINVNDIASIRYTVNTILESLKNDIDLPSYKMAQENARYMISVFTPTVMMYTVSLRQVMLIIEYLNKLSESAKKNTSNFYKSLADSAKELADEFLYAIGNKVILTDIKNQSIRFFEGVDETKGYNKSEYIGDSYTLRYTASLAMLAQAQRHRTIRYSMYIPTEDKYSFYIPRIIREYGLEDEWLTDIKSVAYCTPQGTLVDVTEQGIFEDFALKCKERLCGRAQLEIATSTAEQAHKFIENKENMCEYNQSLLDAMTNSKCEVAPRCCFRDFRCTDGCRWGAKEGLTRSI